MGKFEIKDISGQKFGRLTVIKIVGKDKSGKYKWLCKCECGNLIKVSGGNLRDGHTKSCGCLRREMMRERSTQHKMVNTLVYKSWAQMKQRCLNKNSDRYKYHGGRGITICKEWLKFENFFADMGNRPISKSIDRIDNEKGYCKQNCRWATIKQQANNRRNNHFLTFKNNTKTLAQWSKETGIRQGTLYYRISVSGWSVAKTLMCPPRH